MLVSIIIPTFNEEARIAEIIHYIRNRCEGGTSADIIVADGYSVDETVIRAKQAGARTIQASRGRGNQMNAGASIARGEILYFLHADTFPPASLLGDLRGAVSDGFSAGCYRLSFDFRHWFLRLNCWFTRYDFTPFRFGDQSLFVRKDLFARIGGFNGNMLLLEDQEIVRRVKRTARFKVLDAAVITSSRKYLSNGIFRLQFLFALIYMLYRLGVGQSTLLRLYRAHICDERPVFDYECVRTHLRRIAAGKSNL